MFSGAWWSRSQTPAPIVAAPTTMAAAITIDLRRRCGATDELGRRATMVGRGAFSGRVASGRARLGVNGVFGLSSAEALSSEAAFGSVEANWFATSVAACFEHVVDRSVAAAATAGTLRLAAAAGMFV